MEIGACGEKAEIKEEKRRVEGEGKHEGWVGRRDHKSLKRARPSPDYLGTIPILQADVLCALSNWPTGRPIAPCLAVFPATFPDTLVATTLVIQYTSDKEATEPLRILLFPVSRKRYLLFSILASEVCSPCYYTTRSFGGKSRIKKE